MAFILVADRRDGDVAGAFRRYQEYVQSVREVFPPSAYALATSDRYFNFKDHRCSHDAWLETSSLSEASSANGGKKRSCPWMCASLAPITMGTLSGVIPKCSDTRLTSPTASAAIAIGATMSFESLTEDTWSMKSSGRVFTPLASGLSRHQIWNSAGSRSCDNQGSCVGWVELLRNPSSHAPLGELHDGFRGVNHRAGHRPDPVAQPILQ